MKSSKKQKADFFKSQLPRMVKAAELRQQILSIVAIALEKAGLTKEAQAYVSKRIEEAFDSSYPLELKEPSEKMLIPNMLQIHAHAVQRLFFELSKAYAEIHEINQQR